MHAKSGRVLKFHDAPDLNEESRGIDFSDTRRKDNSFQIARCKSCPAYAPQLRVGSKCNSTHPAAIKGTFINGHEGRRESNRLQPRTTAKSGGFDPFNALLEAQVHEARNVVKGTFPNLANSGRDNNALRFSQTTNNFLKLCEERAGH
jgi:hypothetical protein